MRVIESIEERCKECYGCVRICPVKAIKVRDGQAEVLEEKCIYCGRCINACTQGAKQAKTEIDLVKGLLSSHQVVAILASECVASFYPATPTQVAAGLEKLGFFSVEDTLLGEELVADEYMKLFKERAGEPIVRSTCPAVVTWLEKYYPEFLAYLAPIISPVIAQGRLVKEMYDPGTATVYIGPCVAAKAEVRDDPVADAIDAVLTFDELRLMFKEADINLESLPPVNLDAVRPVLLRMFSLSGGFPRETIANYSLLDRDIRVIRGIYGIEKLADAFLRGEVRPKLIDVLDCDGCVDGPAMGDNMSTYARKNIIEQYYKEKSKSSPRKVNFKQILPRLPWIEMRREFTSKEVKLPFPTEEELKEVLATAEKCDQRDELDCGACGYESCREEAIAIYQGLAEWGMCFPFQRRLFLKVVEQLRQTSITDGLTGLSNHKNFMERLKVEFKRALRYGSPLSLIMIDVDLFKPINDTYGHVRGDEVLKIMAQIIKRNIREADLAARYGGDEFALILPETDKTEAFAVAEKLRRKVEAHEFILNGNPNRITISLGITPLTPNIKDVATFVEKADKAMYKAKESGRNRAYIAPD
ncbi:MAG: diguanylate cyclase [Actinomycetota bacterium]